MADADDDRLDAALATLTDPGEDAGFRARVLSRVDASVEDARPSRAGRWAAAGVLVAAALVVGTFYAWRPQRPAGHDVARVELEAQAASPAGGAIVPAASSAEPARDTNTLLADKAPARRVAVADRRTSAAAREPQVVVTRDSLADEQPLPYGMERIRLAPVSIQQFALREVREDPALAALMPPDPVRVDPIDIEEIAPRR